MERKIDRTIEKYERAGAMMRLYKTLGTKLVVELSSVISAADQDKMMRAMGKIDEVCSKADNNMFTDHPQVTNDYINVFYGSTDSEPISHLDRKIIKMAREVADELFERKGY
jgi:hypothetical protein